MALRTRPQIAQIIRPHKGRRGAAKAASAEAAGQQTGTPYLYEGVLFVLFADVRKQCHEPRLLDGRRELALMLGADVRVTRVDDLCLARNEPAQKIDLFIVDILEVLRAEKALL